MVAPVAERAETPAPPPHLGRASWVFALSLAFALAGLVRAETLIDPTRSPLGERAAAEGLAAAADATPPPATRLQMIVRGPGETRAAVIDGNKVRVGDSVRVRGGTARVERITDTGVVLARGDEHETLQLLPGIERSVQCARRPDSQRPGGC
ncbi:MAG TPA: hypothetical protein VMG60_07200 [Burkholderiaceae bacterium]|nr:hypothetical protein [Burkholderiaceae bacterium]